MIGMFFQWDQFITPKIIRIFYYLQLIALGLLTLFSLISGIGMMRYFPGAGLGTILATLLGFVIGVILVRILTEMLLVAFRINENLQTIRDRGPSV